MNELETLTAKIVKAVPECNGTIHGFARVLYDKIDYYQNLDNVPTEDAIHEAIAEFGRPITLEDVLQAIGEKKIEVEQFHVDSRGCFYELEDDEGRDRWCAQITYDFKFIKWSLGKPLSSQSPEVISFLNSLL